MIDWKELIDDIRKEWEERKKEYEEEKINDEVKRLVMI
jgi:hypothetical protein